MFASCFARDLVAVTSEGENIEQILRLALQGPEFGLRHTTLILIFVHVVIPNFLFLAALLVNCSKDLAVFPIKFK